MKFWLGSTEANQRNIHADLIKKSKTKILVCSHM